MARLDELERKFEENPRRYFAPLANEYRKAGDAQRAVDLCRAQLPEIPGHISGHIVLGQALYEVGDYPGSKSALEAALTLDPENIVALRYLGDIARDTGDPGEAARWYTRTLEADPYSEAAQAGLQSLHEPSDGSGEAQPEAVGSEAPEQTYEPPAADLDSTEPQDAEPEAPEPQDADSESLEPQHADWESSTAKGGEAPMADFVASAYIADAPADIADAPGDTADASAEFAGDLEVSAAAEPLVSPSDETLPQEIAPDPVEPEATAMTDVAADVLADIEAHPPSEREVQARALQAEEPLQTDEALQTEERVLEAAAPFVTETMADLYMEQGYPHEALELMLQLSEQRPEDESLRMKIGRIESVIIARRDAAVAAARAERADAAPAPEHESLFETAEAPSGPVVVDDGGHSSPEVAPAAMMSVREMFVRMDGARPRVTPAAPPRPAPALRSDFFQMPETQSSAGIERRSDTGEQRSTGVPRVSGPHQTFDPSTANIDDFDAWLRGLRGP